MSFRCLLLALLTCPALLPGQPNRCVADSLFYSEGRVHVFKRGTPYRIYDIGYRRPSYLVADGARGEISFTCRLDEACAVHDIRFSGNSRPAGRRSVREAARRAALVFRAYRYENCARVELRDTIALASWR